MKSTWRTVSFDVIENTENFLMTTKELEKEIRRLHLYFWWLKIENIKIKKKGK